MPTTFRFGPETAALFARAGRAMAESRRLVALNKLQRDRAANHIQHMIEIGTEVGMPPSSRQPMSTLLAGRFDLWSDRS